MPFDDGGPAFPVQEPLEKYDNEQGRYVTSYQPTGGMTLRDFFAAKALQGLLAAEAHPQATGYPSPETDPSPAFVFAKHAYELADALLEARVAAPAAVREGP